MRKRLPDSALPLMRQMLESAGGFATLLLPRQLTKPFAVVPSDEADDLLDFNRGRRWSQSHCDDLLPSAVEAEFPTEWWALYENVWSVKGDLPEDDELGAFFFYGTEYLLPAVRPNFLDLRRWRGNAVGFLKNIYLLSMDPLRANKPGSSLDAVTAYQLSQHVVAAILSAYDDESWIGATIS